MRKQVKYILLIIISFSFALSFSQNREKDTINTGVIDVVKPYKPSISDAFKVKETPTLDDETTTIKKEVKYNIFSFPVASTFTPVKGKATAVEKPETVKFYNNYATLALGSYTTILGEVYLNHDISKTESVGGYVSHHSSAGGIDNVQVDDNFSNSKINANYASRSRDLSWNVEAGFAHQMYNWYGFDAPFASNTDLLNSLDLKHDFYNGHLGGDIKLQNGYFNSGSFLFRRFGDNQGSAESRFLAKSTIEAPIAGKTILADIKIDYLSGAFDRNYFTADELSYSNFQIGFSPSYEFKRDNLEVNLGFSAVYLNDGEAGESNVYIYPNITATYRLVNDVLIAYGGVEGGLIQNSYHGFASENLFVSPTLFIVPTDREFDAYLGLKGKLSSNINYNLSGSYVAENNSALFRKNITALDLLNAENYQYGNSFGVVYDNLNTFGVLTEIGVDLNRNFKLGLKAEYFIYDNDNEAEAWNLPLVKGSMFFDYQINEHWFTGANLFYVGERKDLLSLDNTPEAMATTVVLDSFFDANAHLGYHLNDQISLFVKSNNIANNMYQRWQNLPVQGIQFLVGANFKFDF